MAALTYNWLAKLWFLLYNLCTDFNKTRGSKYSMSSSKHFGDLGGGGGNRSTKMATFDVSYGTTVPTFFFINFKLILSKVLLRRLLLLRKSHKHSLDDSEDLHTVTTLLKICLNLLDSAFFFIPLNTRVPRCHQIKLWYTICMPTP